MTTAVATLMRPLIPTILILAVFTSPLTAAHGYHDSKYHEVILFEWDTAELDVLIIPPASSHAVWRTEAVEESIDAWEAGIQALAPSWLANGLEIRRYTLGSASPPPSGFELDDPEIIVTSTEPGVLGIGIPTDFFVCDTVPFLSVPEAIDALLEDAHGHGDSPWRTVATSTCKDSTENVCLVVNTNWMTYQNGLYDLNSHELGHCLGIGHVGDAADFHATTFPVDDIMSYQHDPNNVHCVSTLNTLALEFSFADVLGGSYPTVDYPSWDPNFAYVSMNPGSYSQYGCSNPTQAPIPDPDWFPL